MVIVYMKSKRGWIKIVEASIAILIIFSILLVVSRQQTAQQSTDLTETIRPILEEMAQNVTLREDIVKTGNASVPELEQFVGSRIRQSSLNFSVSVCDVSEICSLRAYPPNVGDIYADERVISSTLNEYSPTKVKIFMWRIPA